MWDSLMNEGRWIGYLLVVVLCIAVIIMRLLGKWVGERKITIDLSSLIFMFIFMGIMVLCGVLFCLWAMGIICPGTQP